MKKKKQSEPAQQMDLTGVTTASIRERHSKVRVEDFARVVEPGQWFARMEEALPRILAGNTFRQVVNHILTAAHTGKPVIFMLGAHVIKCGLSGLIVDLMRRGVVTAVALNGAGAIHDVEIAVWGQTSEDVALGTDVIHQHPSTDGAIVGELSFRDFKILAGLISRIGGGGVVLNVGSAVILPEVFLKCLSLARNVHGEIGDFTTVNLDMIRHYRPTVNLIERPSRLGGQGYELTGHHELMIPLLAAAIRFGLEKEASEEE